MVERPAEWHANNKKTIGRVVVTSKSGGSRFESGLCQFLNISHFCIHYKNKEKESWNGPSKIKGRSLGCVLKEHLTKMKWSSLN